MFSSKGKFALLLFTQFHVFTISRFFVGKLVSTIRIKTFNVFNTNSVACILLIDKISPGNHVMCKINKSHRVNIWKVRNLVLFQKDILLTIILVQNEYKNEKRGDAAWTDRDAESFARFWKVSWECVSHCVCCYILGCEYIFDSFPIQFPFPLTERRHDPMDDYPISIE